MNQLAESLRLQLLLALGNDEDSPNWEEEVTLETGKGAITDNYLIGQGCMTWIINRDLWNELSRY